MKSKLLLAASSLLFVACNEAKDDGPRSFHFETGGFEVAAGTEFYQCFIVKAPTGGTATKDVGAVRFAYTPGSAALHHIVIFSGGDDEVEGTRPCELFESGWEVRYAGGTATDPLEPPEGVAVPVRPMETWVIQLHYLNSGDAPIIDDTAVDIDFTKPGDAFIPAALVIAGSDDISLPPNSPSEVVGLCGPNDGFPEVSVYSFWPHMHQKGVHFKIEMSDDGGPMTTLYDQDYDFGDQSTWQPATPIVVSGADVIRTTCSYNNTSNEIIGFGESSNQEMCFNFIFYYPRPAIAPGMVPCL